MSQIIRMIAAQGSTSSAQDELELLASSTSTRRLAQTIIDKLYNNPLLFNSLITSNPTYSGEYDFGLVNRVFADYAVASTKLNNGRLRYFMGPKDTVYRINGVDLYLCGEWYAISRAKPTPNHNWPSINELIRVLDNRFQGTFVYVQADDRVHQLWGPSGTL